MNACRPLTRDELIKLLQNTHRHTKTHAEAFIQMILTGFGEAANDISRSMQGRPKGWEVEWRAGRPALLFVLVDARDMEDVKKIGVRPGEDDTFELVLIDNTPVPCDVIAELASLDIDATVLAEHPAPPPLARELQHRRRGSGGAPGSPAPRSRARGRLT